MKLSKAMTAAAAAVVLIAAGVVVAHSTQAAPFIPYPVANSFWDGENISLLFPGASPPGANNWSCRPSAAHPRPVVLVHGTIENQTNNWQAASATLANNGYCVFAFNFGGR